MKFQRPCGQRLRNHCANGVFLGAGDKAAIGEIHHHPKTTRANACHQQQRQPITEHGFHRPPQHALGRQPAAGLRLLLGPCDKRLTLRFGQHRLRLREQKKTGPDQRGGDLRNRLRAARAESAHQRHGERHADGGGTQRKRHHHDINADHAGATRHHTGMGKRQHQQRRHKAGTDGNADATNGEYGARRQRRRQQ